MIDKLAGLPTQIRQLEKRLKDMDASKVKPALVKEITDTIKNLKDMLKEKQEKREQRKKDKEQAAPEVQKEAITVPSATEIGAVAPNAVNPVEEGQPEATPTTPNNQNASCPLCGGLKFADQAQYQSHMQFTHGSNVMPTNPVQKLDKTVASTEPAPVQVEAGNKCVLCNIEFANWPEYDAHRKEKHGPTSVKSEAETGPQFKLDDVVMPARGSESKGKVMRWDGKPNDLVYVMWESGPLKDRDTFGGYYPHDLKVDAPPAPVEAAMPVEEPVCEKCVSMQEKHGDLKTNYEALLKDLQEEREIHYTQGNHSWVMRLDQKIEDLKNAIAEKFPSEVKPEGFNMANEKQAAGGPRLIRQIHRATSGHGYEATEYDLGNGQFKQNVPLKINETKVRMTDPTSTQFEVKYDGMDWRMVAPQEFEQWLEQWKETNHANTKNAATDYPVDPKWGPDHDVSPWTCSCGATLKSKNEGLAHFRAHHGKGKTAGAQNAEQLTIMDHTPPRANSGPDVGGKDPADEFQDEWAMPVTSEVKLNVFKRELLATPTKEGYDISHEGKKLFNITGKDKKPMNKKQLEFCAQIEFTRGMKQAKLVEKIANLEAGSTVFIMAHDKTSKRVKFASLEHGYRGWASASKFAYLVKEGQMMQHKDHIDNTFGNNGKQVLVDCPNGSGNMVWLQMGELLPINPPPATPESLNDLESALGCKYCDHRSSSHTDGKGNSAGCSICDCSGYAKSTDKEATQKCKECGTGHMPLTRGICAPCRKDKKASIDFPLAYFTRPEAKQRADQFGLIDVEDSDLTPAGLAAKKQEILEGHDIEAKKKKKKKKKKPCKNCGVFYFPIGLGRSHTPCPPSDGGDAGGMGGAVPAASVGVAAASETKNPISWNDANYWDVLVDMDGNVISGYTYEQGEEAGWDLYFTPEEDIAWNNGELVLVYTDGKSPELNFQWGGAYGAQGFTGFPEEQQPAKEAELTPKILSQIKVNTNSVEAAKECPDCHGTFEGTEGEKCPTCGRFAVQKESLRQALPPQIVNRRTEVNAAKKCEKCHKEFEPQHRDNRFCSKECYRNSGEPVTASLNKESRVIEREDGWHVLSEKGKNLGGPYTSKAQAVKRLRQVEYFKHNSTVRPFGRKVIAEAMIDPYESLTSHITDMRSRMTQVQDKIQTVPAIKTAGEDNTKMDLPALFEDITHGIALLEEKLGGDENADPEIHKQVEELENKLWKLEQECGITPKLSEHEKAEPEHKEIVEDIEKEANTPLCSVDGCKNKADSVADGKRYCYTHSWGKKHLKEAVKKTAARPDPDEPQEESEESDLMDNFVQLKNGQFALVQSHDEGGIIEVDLLGKAEQGYKWVTESPIPVPVSAVKRILEWDEIQGLNIQDAPMPTVEVSPVKQADQVTDVTIQEIVTNDPTNPLSPEQAAAVPTIQNVQPTDDDNLSVPVVAPTSPPPPGQKWVFDTQFNKYVAMPDPAAR